MSAIRSSARRVAMPDSSAQRRVAAGLVRGPARPGGSRHRDDDLAAYVSFLQVAQARGGVRERVGPVDDRREVAGLDELDDGEQVLPGPGVRERSEALPDEAVGDDD